MDEFQSTPTSRKTSNRRKNNIDIKSKPVSYYTDSVVYTAVTRAIQPDGGVVIDSRQGLGLG
jgi:hypothetical protein